MEKPTRYAEIIAKVAYRLALIWEKKEGDLTIEVRDIDGKVVAKIKGGETDRL